MEILLIAGAVLVGSMVEDILRIVCRQKKSEPLPIEKWLDERYLGLETELESGTRNA